MPPAKSEDGARFKKVSIIYDERDAHFQETVLVPLLESHGFEIKHATGSRTSKEWEESIVADLSSSGWYIVIMSSHSRDSEWVGDVVHWVLENDPSQVVGLQLDSCDPGDYHFMMVNCPLIDFGTNTAKARAFLLEALRVPTSWWAKWIGWTPLELITASAGVATAIAGQLLGAIAIGVPLVLLGLDAGSDRALRLAASVIAGAGLGGLVAGKLVGYLLSRDEQLERSAWRGGWEWGCKVYLYWIACPMAGIYTIGSLADDNPGGLIGVLAGGLLSLMIWHSTQRFTNRPGSTFRQRGTVVGVASLVPSGGVVGAIEGASLAGELAEGDKTTLAVAAGAGFLTIGFGFLVALRRLLAMASAPPADAYGQPRPPQAGASGQPRPRGEQVQASEVRAFICYDPRSEHDRCFVTGQLESLLQEVDVVPTYLAEGREDGPERRDEFLRKAATCDWFLVVMSASSAESPYVKDALFWALRERRGRILPILLEECDVARFSLGLSRIDYIDWQRAPSSVMDRLRRIAWKAPPVPRSKGWGRDLAPGVILLPLQDRRIIRAFTIAGAVEGALFGCALGYRHLGSVISSAGAALAWGLWGGVLAGTWARVLFEDKSLPRITGIIAGFCSLLSMPPALWLDVRDNGAASSWKAARLIFGGAVYHLMILLTMLSLMFLPIGLRLKHSPRK